MFSTPKAFERFRKDRLKRESWSRARQGAEQHRKGWMVVRSWQQCELKSVRVSVGLHPLVPKSSQEKILMGVSLEQRLQFPQLVFHVLKWLVCSW